LTILTIWTPVCWTAACTGAQAMETG
jgi:hypothetical protein